MGLRETVRRAFGRHPLDADDTAIEFTQAMLGADAAAVDRLSWGTGVPTSQALLQRFAEADLARWFSRFRSLAAPVGSLPEAESGTVLRYVVGRVSLPDNAVQEFPILTVGLVHKENVWRVIAARANARLFDEGDDASSSDDPSGLPDSRPVDEL